ncbi:hypothetical protein AZE42_03880 [Rhizopogon vesiculosus]|uniref:Uncharacterized protein n=1 Tax=Rhizopogon vesiculosus TaxID=180088 RepID=A0A1J8QN74_9AGAM|nr:hypothetical protein AZE42_03880 [Rhizopogon vesiculosus]
MLTLLITHSIVKPLTLHHPHTQPRMITYYHLIVQRQFEVLNVSFRAQGQSPAIDLRSWVAIFRSYLLGRKVPRSIG